MKSNQFIIVGGGFYFEAIANTFIVRGIVSASYATSNGSCDLSQYAVFTNVAKFSDWIWQTVEALSN